MTRKLCDDCLTTRLSDFLQNTAKNYTRIRNFYLQSGVKAYLGAHTFQISMICSVFIRCPWSVLADMPESNNHGWRRLLLKKNDNA